jgi:hypothetical protein
MKAFDKEAAIQDFTESLKRWKTDDTGPTLPLGTRGTDDFSRKLLLEVIDLLVVLGLDKESLRMLRALNPSLSGFPSREAVETATQGVAYYAIRIWNLYAESGEKRGPKTYPVYFTAAELEALKVDPLPVLAEDVSPLTLKNKIARAKIFAGADREGKPVCRDCMEPWESHGRSADLPPCIDCSGTGGWDGDCKTCDGRGGPGASLPGYTAGFKVGY